jgi:hypothetical protein
MSGLRKNRPRGSKFRYRSARLRSFSLGAALGEDDLPPEN